MLHTEIEQGISPHGLTCLRFLWETYRDRIPVHAPPDVRPIDHFYFCLLGGYAITYELNLSAFTTLRDKGLLNPEFLLQVPPEPELALKRELATPQFLPTTASGKPRKYRFPATKSRIIVQATQWLKSSFGLEVERLLSLSPTEIRDLLVTCPGFGYKTASWFLRNSGHIGNVAVLDIHLQRVLIAFGIIPKHWTPERHYLEIERAFLIACDSIGADPGALDLIIWWWERGSPIGGIRSESTI